MTTSEFVSATRDAVAALPAWVPGLGVVVLLALAGLLVRWLHRWGRSRLARIVQLSSTALGLAWSAQGMYDVATDDDLYNLPGSLALVLCVVFESLLIRRMMVTEKYRGGNRLIRQRHVRSVWVLGVVMALVVSFGEGWAQAPARLAVPLLVVYGWFMDLTADDDPAARPETAWRWTPRELGLALGLLRFTDRDRKTVTDAERDRLRERLARLGLADRIGHEFVGMLLRRRTRLARLIAAASPEMVEEARLRVARAAAAYEKGLSAPASPPPTLPAPETHPVMPPQPAEPVHVPTPEPTPAAEPAREPEKTIVTRLPGNVTVRQVGDKVLVGPELMEHAIGLVIAKSLTNEQLMGMYDPPLGQRTAEKWGAEARRRVRSGRVNGHRPDALVE